MKKKTRSYMIILQKKIKAYSFQVVYIVGL